MSASLAIVCLLIAALGFILAAIVERDMQASGSQMFPRGHVFIAIAGFGIALAFCIGFAGALLEALA